jgi:hypothetical protein
VSGGVISHLTTDALEAGLDHIRSAPRDVGRLELIVRRPSVDVREELEHGELDLAVGLVGDTWHTRRSRMTADGSPHPKMQLNIMSARVVALVAQDKARWSLAGDQLFVDFDLSEQNLPPGTRIAIGATVVEVTDQPHLGCRKFVERFGLDAMNFVNSPLGCELHLRGINARVVQPGPIRVGDTVHKLR